MLPISRFARTTVLSTVEPKALGEEVVAPYPNVYIWRVRIPFDQFDHPRNYLTKLMRYNRLLDARNPISELREFVDASVRCWERRIPFGVYNMTNSGSITTREVVDMIAKSGVCEKEYTFFESEAEFMHIAASTPRSNCVMSSDKLLRTGILLTEVHDAIERDLHKWRKAGFGQLLIGGLRFGSGHSVDQPASRGGRGTGSVYLS